MGQVEPLEVTLELPASEFTESDGKLLVRCPITRTWVELFDYYSELEGQLLPLVGRADLSVIGTHWQETEEKDYKNDPVMVQVEKEPIEWHEVVRILPKVEEEPEGGSLEFNVHDKVEQSDKMV